MKKKIYKREKPKTVEEYEKIITRAYWEWYRYISEAFGFLFFEKDIINKVVKAYVWGQDTKDISKELESIIEYWNKKFWEKRIITIHLQDAYKKIRHEYKKENVEDAFRAYIEKKENEPPEYRLSPIKFLTQKVNGLVSYL